MKSIEDIIDDGSKPYGILSMAALRDMLQYLSETEQFEDAAKVRDIINQREAKLKFLYTLSKQIKNL